MPSNFILDFEAYQVDADYYPVEICLLNIVTRQCNMFFIRYPNAIESNTSRFQYFYCHGMGWQDGNISFAKAMKAIRRRVKTDDTIFIKGEQKANFIRKCLPKHNILEVTAPSIHTLFCLRDKCCKYHYAHKQWSCARHKAFALIPFVKVADT
jgi:hypothetical protein